MNLITNAHAFYFLKMKLPKLVWSYTGGHLFLKSTIEGRVAAGAVRVERNLRCSTGIRSGMTPYLRTTGTG